MKAALALAPFSGVNAPLLGIASLAAYLKAHGHEACVFDFNAETHAVHKNGSQAGWWRQHQAVCGSFQAVTEFFEANRPLFDGFVDRVIASRADVVGFTLLWATEMMSRLLAAEIKRRDPSKIIVFGGPQCVPGIARDDLLDTPYGDFVVHGEGEAALLELMDSLQGGGGGLCIDGVISRRDRVLKRRALLQNLDQLPFPDFDGFPLDLYAQPLTLPASTSRGCPNSCHYCNEKNFWLSFRPYTGERIFAEVSHQVRKHGAQRIEFTDSLVNGKVKFLERFCDLAVESKLGISWIGQAVVRKEMDLPLLEKIRASGCVHLCFGAEHSSTDFMRSVGKNLIRGADLDRLVRDCHQAKLPIGLNWMFGFPGEGEDEFRQDIDFFTRNAAYLKSASVNNSPGFCGFVPGTPGYEAPEALGIVMGPDSVTWKTKDGTNTYVTRLEKYQAFCRHLDGLGVAYACPPFPNEDELVGDYYFNVEKDFAKALDHYRAELEKRPDDRELLGRIGQCQGILAGMGKGERLYLLPDSTDQNWTKGVAKGWAAAFFVESGQKAADDFRPGRTVELAGGIRRRIDSVRENGGTLIVQLKGAPLDGDVVGHPNTVKILPEG